MASLRFISVIAAVASCCTALQVTPNSPCASLCIDSSDLDLSDPNSSTTTSHDISCHDSDYSSTPTGQKFQSCMSCLQDSTFSQGSENDQLWFLCMCSRIPDQDLTDCADNLRYTFDYCVFGFPNATDVGSSPCATSTACGQLKASLEEGQLSSNNPSYGYCSVDGAMTGDSVPGCISCVAASEDQEYLANYLIALQAGCEQQPPAGAAIGLNDTVFSSTQIEAVDPSETKTSDDSEKSSVSIPEIAGIVVGAIAVLLVIAGFLFVRCRKQRNRRMRLEGNVGSPLAPKRGHRPASSLSFRCQTHLSPRSPAFFLDPSDSTIEEEKVPQSAISPADSLALGYSPWHNSSPTDTFKSFTRPESSNPGLHIIKTGIPSIPSNVHYSPTAKGYQISPVEQTPISTTSTKSTSQLLPLRPYNPAEYGVAGPNTGSSGVSYSPETSYTSPTSGTTASPLLSRVWDNQQQRAPTWDTPQPQYKPRTSSIPSNVRPMLNVSGALERMSGKATGPRRVSKTGSPVETKMIEMNFAAPPSRR
ncbi:hypothetical protein F5Y15DRAFT_36275 [Xylariaceae sp. FL0016]|nr:hypothetical protein F5Y15DRAFT_36275 [Xylariaceae sp. FL0016]